MPKGQARLNGFNERVIGRSRARQNASICAPSTRGGRSPVTAQSRRSDHSRLGVVLRSVTAVCLQPGDETGGLVGSGVQEVPLAAENPSQRC
jgi:hypothetical protein